MTEETIKNIKEWIIYAIIVVAASMFIVTFIAQRTIVDGNSMNNTLQNGDNLVVDKVSYRFSDPDRFDIVVFRYHNEKNTFYIKRIIGLPGETIQIVDDDIYVDGKLLEEDYGKDPMLEAGRATEPVTLGNDEYFVLGDNRNDSADSRDPSVGNIQEDWIVGRALFRITPLKKMGLLLEK
ncbi:MAG: signal peptidase I [Lachnospiraceae bacterium]|nr:signal peptidase I [Lachnospiraceae bacterium]